MTRAYNNSGPSIASHVLRELRDLGIADDDINMAVDLQQQQRLVGAPVLPLRVLLGLEAPLRSRRSSLSATAAKLAVPAAMRRRTGGLHVTRRPVWANSVPTGDAAETAFVQPLTAGQRRQLASACHKTFQRGRALAIRWRAGEELDEKERLLVRFTRSCRDVMLRLLDEQHFRKGWCFPAYETIARWTDLSRRTVHYAINVLRSLGMLEWLRRYDFEKDKDVGARSTQTSNLYRCSVPKWLASLLGLRNPPPDDDAERRKAELEEYAHMLASADPNERRRLMPDDPARRAALLLAAQRSESREGPALQNPECKNSTDPHHSIFISGNGIKGVALDGQRIGVGPPASP